MNMMAKAKPISFSFTLERVDLVTPSRYLELNERNSNLKKEAEFLYVDPQVA
jgi:hypothetical protein